jgi:hypothetical protein
MGEMAPISQPVAGSLLNIVAAAAADPNTDVDKLRMLIDLQRTILADDARMQFTRAMAAAQAEMQPVLRDAPNSATNSRYARYETIDAVIRPIYSRHGFALEFSEADGAANGNRRITCEVSHVAGHIKTRWLDAPTDTMGARGNANKTELHGLGSTLSYLRRYLLCAAFNIVTANEDNDGNRERARDDGELIGRAQIAELRALMVETRILESSVLAKKAPELTTIEALPAARFADFRNSLLSRKRVQTQRMGEAA